MHLCASAFMIRVSVGDEEETRPMVMLRVMLNNYFTLFIYFEFWGDTQQCSGTIHASVLKAIHVWIQGTI